MTTKTNYSFPSAGCHTQSEPSRSIPVEFCLSMPLSKTQLERYNQFFQNGREYKYSSKIKTVEGEKELTFTLHFMDYIKICVERLQAKGIKVQGAFIKGGAVHQILNGSSKPLADIDVTIQIEHPDSWSAVEGAICDALADKNIANIQVMGPTSPINGVYPRTYYYDGIKILFRENEYTPNAFDTRQVFLKKGGLAN